MSSTTMKLRFFHGEAIGVLKLFWVICLIPLTGFAEQKWASFEEMMNSSSYEKVTKEISFETRGPVQVSCSYPILFGKGELVEYVNQDLKVKAENQFDKFVEDEKLSDEEWEDECSLSYALFPAYQVSNLISIGGCWSYIRNSHSSTSYEGKNYWRRGDSIIKLFLDDLFIKGSGYRSFMLQYCENYFKSSGYGYYSSLPEFPPQLESHDLDIFVLTDKGLMIIFRAYRVGGSADGPDTVLIPYAELKEFIDPLGPLKEKL